MPKPALKSFVGLVLVLFIISQACAAQAAPTVPPADLNAIDTAIAGTMAAAWTQTAQSAPILEKLISTPPPTKTLSPTPFPTFTIVVASPRLFVSRDTDCRKGPGQVYKLVVSLNAGESASVIGRSADAQYWIIRNPKNPNQPCWISGQYATVTGVAGILRVFTPPPTPKPTHTPKPPTHTPRPSTPVPAPSFTAQYTDTAKCAGPQWWVRVNLKNDSSVTFQSIAIGMQDVFNGQTFSLTSDDFIASDGCGNDTADTLPPGASHLVSLPPLMYDPTGHQLLVAISLCSETGQKGTCAVRALDFTP